MVMPALPTLFILWRLLSIGNDAIVASSPCLEQIKPMVTARESYYKIVETFKNNPDCVTMTGDILRSMGVAVSTLAPEENTAINFMAGAALGLKVMGNKAVTFSSLADIAAAVLTIVSAMNPSARRRNKKGQFLK